MKKTCCIYILLLLSIIPSCKSGIDNVKHHDNKPSYDDFVSKNKFPYKIENSRAKVFHSKIFFIHRPNGIPKFYDGISGKIAYFFEALFYYLI